MSRVRSTRKSQGFFEAAGIVVPYECNTIGGLLSRCPHFMRMEPKIQGMQNAAGAWNAENASRWPA